MTRRASIAIVLFVVMAAAPGQAPPTQRPDLAGFEQTRVRIDSRRSHHWLDVYLALTPAQRARGLMFVESLPEDHGMLFLYPRPQFVAMWMKNTPLPLDMLFIGVGGYIRQIEGPTEPYSLESIHSNDAVIAVLELEAGTAERLGIEVGDRLIFRSLIDAAMPTSDPD